MSGFEDYEGEGRDGYTPGRLEQADIEAETEASHSARTKTTGYEIVDVGTIRAVFTKSGIKVLDSNEPRPELTEELFDAS